MSVDDYVSDFVTYRKKVHKYVDEQHALVRENTQRTKYRELGAGGSLTIGDYCLVKKAIGVSANVFNAPPWTPFFKLWNLMVRVQTLKPIP